MEVFFGLRRFGFRALRDTCPLCLSVSVVPSMLCCLTSPVQEVRRAALSVLQSLSGSRSSPFQPITERLLKTSEELLSDPLYLSTVSSLSGFRLQDKTRELF